MIKIPYDDIIAKIKANTSLSDEEIKAKLKAKMDQLAGLISKEGAAHIIANELGVKIFDNIDGKMKINKILSGMRSVEVIGKITNIYEIREFNRQDGGTGKVASFQIADETASTRVVLWNDMADKLKELKPDSIIQIKDAYVKQNNSGRVELHLSSKSVLTINPKGETIGEIAKKQKAERKTISNLKDTDSNVELLATVVQVFDPRFYEVCPECNKRLKQKEAKWECPAHGEVAPSYSVVLNLVLDDGTSTIRSVFFKNQVVNLLKTTSEGILKLKDSPADFQPIKDGLLGNIIKIVGKVSKNEMFDRTEFVVQLVFPEPRPDDELQRLEKEAEETIE